jgi:succinoglycan biosynthesis protein ExoM
VNVVICICTYRRPAMLDELLTSLEEMVDHGGRVRLVVVDNDPPGSARGIVEKHASIDIAYEIEPRCSISAVRHRSVQLALVSEPDVVAFLDDDQRVDPLWLHEILTAFERFDAQAVAGAVTPVLSDAAPEWVRRGGFFSRSRYPTGARVRPSGLANFAIRGQTLAAIPEPFGLHFGKPGGEDTYFLARVASLVGDPYWWDQAVVYEIVPPERATTRWLLARAFRFGRAYTEYLRLMRGSRLRLLRRAAACGLRIVHGVAVLPLACIRGRAAMLRAAAHTCGGVGGLLGFATGVE